MGGCGTSHDVTERGALHSLRFSRRRWPWTCTEEAPEARSAGGGYSDALVAAIETQAAAKVADVSSTAAIEAVAGMLSRAFGDAEVVGEGWVQDVVTPFWLMQVGRSLVREGASLSVLNMGGTGAMELTPAAFYNFEALETPGAEREADWHCRVTTYGPSSSYTRLLARDRLVFVRWGTSPGTRYRGQGPTSWAHLTARLQGGRTVPRWPVPNGCLVCWRRCGCGVGSGAVVWRGVPGLVGSVLGGGRALGGLAEGPSVRCRAQPEHAEARDVGGCGQQVEVGVDFGPAAHTGVAAAVFSAHEVR